MEEREASFPSVVWWEGQRVSGQTRECRYSTPYLRDSVGERAKEMDHGGLQARTQTQISTKPHDTNLCAYGYTRPEKAPSSPAAQ